MSLCSLNTDPNSTVARVINSETVADACCCLSPWEYFEVRRFLGPALALQGLPRLVLTPP